ncbi:MFS transporter [Gluconobacter cerinus]|uniref:MFS transporter n=1 Tax=Gluconobacter cerinus TaxID=38307 RepID=UPI001B8C697B|nr:MFS transporter [Gluconobacter cerinus]MBS1019380.1 MFS transporter [Gluconobacter cerinus]
MTIAVPPENSSLTNVPSPRTSLIFFVLALGAFAIGTAEFTAMSLVPLIAQELQVTVPQAGHAIVAYAMGVGIGAPLIAVLSARLSHKKTLIGLTALYMVGNGLTAFVPSYGYLLICRFVSGLPHGAYFGIAGIIASSLVPPSRRTQAVSRVVLGLTVATVAGVPLASIIGSALGWRWSFGLIAALAFITTVLVSVVVPTDPSRPHANAMAQLRGLKNRQVWLTLGISAVGFGGIFCVYTYLTAIMQEVLHASSTMIAIMLAVFGAGMTTGTVVCAWAADRKMMLTMGGILLVNASALAGFAGSAHNVWELMPVVFMIGCGGGLGTVIQSRLLEVAVGAEAMAAALNQSAFNLSNAVGPALGGLAIAAGFGWTSVGWVGSGLAFGGFMIWLLTLGDIKAKQQRPI